MTTNTYPLALIVEDDAFSAKLYERLLNSVGYESMVRTNYEGAVEYLRKHVPDILVLDMRLEHFDSGPDILKIVRNQVRFKEMRIVIITAYSKMIEKYGDLADMVVLKPLNARELIVYAEEELTA